MFPEKFSIKKMLQIAQIMKNKNFVQINKIQFVLRQKHFCTFTSILTGLQRCLRVLKK